MTAPTPAAAPGRDDPGRSWDRADLAFRLLALAVLALGFLAWCLPGGGDLVVSAMDATAVSVPGLPPFLAGPAWAAALGCASILLSLGARALGALAGLPRLASAARRHGTEGLRRVLGAVASFLSATLAAAWLTLLAGLAGVPLPVEGRGVQALLYVPLMAASVAALAPRTWLLPHLDDRVVRAGGRVFTIPAGPLADVGALLEGLFVGALAGQLALLGALALALLAWGAAALLLAGRDSLAFLGPAVRALAVAGAAAFAARRWLWPRLRETGLFHLRRIEESADGTRRLYGPFALRLAVLPPGAEARLEEESVTLSRRGGGRRVRRDGWLEAPRDDDRGPVRVTLFQAEESRPPWVKDLAAFLRP